YTYLQVDQREYLQVSLKDSLIANSKYYVSLYVALTKSSKYAINSLGIYFSNDSITNASLEYLPFSPQVSSGSNFLTDTSWQKVSDTLIANGGEKYLIIGNFSSDTQTSIIDVGGSLGGGYYFIDDVSVTLIDSIVGITENNNKHGIKVYPNPSMGQFFVEYELKKSEKGRLELYDLIGKKVFSQPLNPGLKREHINLNNQENGIYLYKVIVNEQVVHTEKLLMIKQ
ncbi:MAG: T9SS type A sorting domain-containing protein, partial [Vicingus serpentipes]|nr:T9SS type A sorting domain-containing protein [Vicingus serpentipes]